MKLVTEHPLNSCGVLKTFLRRIRRLGQARRCACVCVCVSRRILHSSRSAALSISSCVDSAPPRHFDVACGQATEESTADGASAPAKTVKITGAVEMKGIVGSDGRYG